MNDPLSELLSRASRVCKAQARSVSDEAARSGYVERVLSATRVAGKSADLDLWERYMRRACAVCAVVTLSQAAALDPGRSMQPLPDVAAPWMEMQGETAVMWGDL